MAQPAPKPATELEPLRENVRLHDGVTGRDGSPTWVLADPATGGHVQIGARELEMLARWHLGTPAAVAERLSAETAFAAAEADVEAVRQFLEGNGLLRIDGRKAHELWQAQRSRGSRMTRLLSEALFRRIPLFAPGPLLAQLAPLVGVVYRRGFWLGLGVVLLLAVYLVGRQWSQFRAGLGNMVGLEGAIAIGMALCVAKTLHELAHAVTAHRYGAEVPTMGVALILAWPVLYTETSAAWTVRNRMQRVQIAAAGIATEAILAVLALASWPLLDPGPLRDAAGFVATTLIVLSVAINANPLMRFDGYFVLAELTGIDNLQPRAQALVAWAARRCIAGIDVPSPEADLGARPARWLLAYGIGSVLYRVVLYGGMAYAIVSLMFPALAFPLALTVLMAYLVLPLLTEIADICRLGWRRAGPAGLIRPALLLALLAAPLLIPWRSSILAPVVIEAGEAHDVFTPEPARLLEIAAADGADLAARAPLYQLVSPQLDFELSRARLEAQQLDRIVDQHLTGQTQHAGLAVRVGELARLRSAIAGLEARRDKLTLTAPVAGRLMTLERSLSPGLWVRPEQPLAKLVVPGRRQARAYVDERDIGLVAVGAEVSLWLDGWPDSSLSGRVEAIFAQALKTLDEPMLAASNGGPLVVRPGERDTLLPEQALYKVRIALPTGDGQPDLPLMKLRAFAKIETPPRNLAGRLLDRLIGLWRRELG